jgi:hypothetical protein
MLSKTNWRYEHDPRRSAVYVLNDIDVKALPELVWKLLIDAENWSRFYAHAQEVKIVTGEPLLALGTKYTWKTADIPLVNTVKEFVPGQRLAWDSVDHHTDAGWMRPLD